MEPSSRFERIPRRAEGMPRATDLLGPLAHRMQEERKVGPRFAWLARANRGGTMRHGTCSFVATARGPPQGRQGLLTHRELRQVSRKVSIRLQAKVGEWRLDSQGE